MCFFQRFLLKNATIVSPIIFFCSNNFHWFLYKRGQRVTKCNFAGEVIFLFFIIWEAFFFLLIFITVFQIILYEQCNKRNPSFEDDMIQNDHLFSPISVSSTLLCLAKYCIHTYPKVHLFTFHMSMCYGRIMLRFWSTSVS